MADIGRRKGDVTLLAALAAGNTVRDAAKISGLSERTATRRTADPAFRKRLAHLQAEAVRRVAGRLVDATGDAVKTLRELLKAEVESVRLGASQAILQLAIQFREGVDLEDRIQRIEEAVNAKQKHSPANGSAGTNGRFAQRVG